MIIGQHCCAAWVVCTAARCYYVRLRSTDMAEIIGMVRGRSPRACVAHRPTYVGQSGTVFLGFLGLSLRFHCAHLSVLGTQQIQTGWIDKLCCACGQRLNFPRPCGYVYAEAAAAAMASLV